MPEDAAMMLFKPEHVPMVLDGTKTETRRIWKRQRAKVGSIHLAKTKMLSKDYFARLRILSVHQEPLLNISEEGAKAEGYSSREGYLEAFYRINNLSPHRQFYTFQDEILVWVVRFEVVP